MNRIVKGLSFNVTLSEEQVEQIASITADKIDYTTRAKDRNDDYYDREIESLKRQIVARDEMIVRKEILIDRLKNRVVSLRSKVEECEDKYGDN